MNEELLAKAKSRCSDPDDEEMVTYVYEKLVSCSKGQHVWWDGIASNAIPRPDAWCTGCSERYGDKPRPLTPAM